MGRTQTVPEMRDDLRKGPLYCDLGLSNVCNVSLETSNPPEGKRASQSRWIDRMEWNGTHSKPASPVRLASLVGFSNRHSRPACLHRLHGGFSAPSHLIFCFRQAFYGSKWKVRQISSKISNYTHACACEEGEIASTKELNLGKWTYEGLC